MTTDEKLAIAIDALRRISGSPVADAAVEFSTGIDPRDDPVTKVARRALTAIGVDLSPYAGMREH